MRFSEYSLPNPLFQLRQPDLLINQDEIDAQVLDPETASQLGEALADHAYDEVKSKFESAVNLTGYWYGTIRNSGNLPATGVELVIPNSVFARSVKFSGGGGFIMYPSFLAGDFSDNGSIRGVFEIGEVRPGYTVKVEVWTTSTPTSKLTEAVALTHDGGKGKVRVDVPSMPLEVWFKRTIAVGVILFFVVLGVSTKIRLVRSSGSDREESPDE